jgi:precorrin-6B methylase 2
MNPVLKTNLLRLLSLPVVKPCFKLIATLLRREEIWNSFEKNEAERAYISTLPSPPSVLDGPFKGLRYQVIHSVGSVLAPKILGTYEAELFDTWAAWKHKNYSHILDIGCAEGFYAVGMARLWPNATVYAYDIDKQALALCKKLVISNGVQDRVRIQGPCSAEILQAFPFSGRALVLSDCEGFEKELFTQETLSALSHADIVIEVHDEAGADFMDEIEKMAKPSHHVSRIANQKRTAGTSPHLAAYSTHSQELIMSEGRLMNLSGRPQYWLVLESQA